MSEQSKSLRLKALAYGAGFDAAGIARADSIPEASSRLSEFLELGRHGEMAWMSERATARANPATLWPDVQTILMVGLNYGPAVDPLECLKRPLFGSISVYARGGDYHDIVKARLKALGRAIAGEFGCELKVFVDTAPVMEKPLAAAAGLGWQGKHTNLVSRQLGSWLFLGAVFLPIEFEPDSPHVDRCGECRRCIDICPTKAFPAPYQLDARRCISYLTIEHKGPIPLAFREAVGNRIYGCDDCLAVCPWNKFAETTRDVKLQARSDLLAPRLDELSMLDDGAFRSRFAGSPIKRTGRDRFVRNVLISIGNSGESDLAPFAERLLDDNSPIVRGAAIWAVSRLVAQETFEALKARNAERESEPGVLEEWRLASVR
jgi:epoxyqueuosine reductase